MRRADDNPEIEGSVVESLHVEKQRKYGPDIFLEVTCSNIFRTLVRPLKLELRSSVRSGFDDGRYLPPAIIGEVFDATVFIDL